MEGMHWHFLIMVAAVLAALLINSYIGVSKFFAAKTTTATS